MAKKVSHIENESGSLTIDFLFASVLIMGITGILFAISFTLTIAEITQYIAFATSRNYYAAHFNEARQETEAQLKYSQLIEQTKWKNLYKKSSWFALKYIGSADFREEYPAQGANDNDRFWGTKLELEAKVLDFQIPFFGSTNPEDKKFKVNITSFLGREPSNEECVNFMNERWKNILALDGKYSSQVSENTKLARIYDNGC